MYDIGLEEKPTHQVPIWKEPATSFRSDGTTYVRVESWANY
jgi:hypothetical protein